MKRLYRSRQNRLIAGVCGGIGEYLDIDPTVVRILWFLCTILSFGICIIVYIAAWILIPREESGKIEPPPESP